MEIALVYREIQKLLIGNESVVLPKVGKLTVVAKSATFLEDCTAILPPKKELLFSPLLKQEENALYEPWQKELGEEILAQLQQSRAFEVPGFGVFRQIEGGEISFEVSPEFDFAPDSFSLEAISLEVNPETVSEPISEPVSGPAQESEQKLMPEPQQELEKAVDEVGPQVVPSVDRPEPAASTDRNQKVLMWSLVAIIAVLLIVLFILLFKEQFAQMFRSLLYTEEELEIIRQWGAR